MFAWGVTVSVFFGTQVTPEVWCVGCFIASCIVYGFALFVFFSTFQCSLYVDQETEPGIFVLLAQGLFMMMTNGVGATMVL